ncbi:MAG: tetratricopeptide repeat protein [Deltaproteobacteria bacterium]|nr:tetratricopeptide repeat protein [Deltaproteobacteria bacterium]
MIHKLIVLGILASTSLAAAQAPPPEQPGSASIAAAEQLFNEARTLFDKGDHAAACPRFEASYKLDAALGTLLNIATCYEKLGRLASAWGRYREVIALATKVGDASRLKIARERADAIEPTLPKLTIRARSSIAGMVVTRDDVPVDPAVLGIGIYVDAGGHTITATAVGRKPFSTKVEVKGSEIKVVILPELAIDPDYKGPAPVATTIRLEQDHFDPGRTRRIVGLSVSGVGIATLVAGFGFGAVARATYDTAFEDDLCDRTTLACTPKGQERTDRARSQSLVANIATIGGAAMIAGGVFIYLTAPSPGRIAITPGVEGGANVSFGGSW